MFVEHKLKDLNSIKDSKYFIPAGINESERLSILHMVFSEPTKKFLRLAGIGTNNRENLKVADVGCATGEMTKWLGENIIGEVVGIDNDIQQIDKALSIVKSTSRCNVKFIVHDITDQDLPGNEYDIVYCRFLLHHLAHPLIAIEKLLKMTKKNGKIILGEPIMDGRWIYPECDEYYEIYNLHLQNKSNHAWDPNFGKRIISEVAKFDNAKIQHFEHFRPILTTEEVKRHHLLVLEIFGEQFVNNGLITEIRLHELKKSALNIARNNLYVSDLFGLVLLCVQKN